jgi:hypothetical protein
MPARNIRAPRDSIQLGTKAREHINAYILIKRLQQFVLIDPDHPKPGDTRLTRTQAFIALALLKKVLPDLASVEVSGNPEKPLMVQVVRFSDGEQLSEPRPIVDMSKLIEMEKGEKAAIETEIEAEASKAAKPRGGGSHRYKRLNGASK